MPEITTMPLFLHHLYLTENLTNISFTGKQRLESCCFFAVVEICLDESEVVEKSRSSTASIVSSLAYTQGVCL